jgi:hypothetical protein
MSKRLTKSGYRGVEKNNTSGWQARICVGSRSNRNRVNLGTFETAKAAAQAYDDAAIEHHGARAVLNFPNRSLRVRMRFSETNAENNATPEEPAPPPIEMPVVMPRSEPQTVPAAVRKRPTIVLPGCCPECGSSLYALAPSAVSDDDKLCRQCAHRPRRARIDARGCRVFSREPEIFAPAGISRRQIDSAEWLELNKGRGVLT